MNPDITLVLPAYNEGESIRATLLEIDEKFQSNNKLFIFVSEDGSKDNTRSEVLDTAKIVKNAHVILAEPADRLGYSKGVLRGIRECRTELIGFMDADGQCDPSELEALIQKVQKGKIVVGYRNPRNDSKARIAYSKAFGFAYRFYGGPKRNDPSSPFVICYLDDIQFIASTTPRLSFGFWWEFQTRIHKRGIGVIEVPVNHRARAAGETQVYALTKIPKIVCTHLIGLYKLSRELKH
jgi:glycosyltransferase involved in cell wall biosynthesis